MKRLLAVALLLITLSLSSMAKSPVVWENPVADYNPNNHDGYFICNVTPVRVEFAPDTTTVTFEVMFRANYWFLISPESHLIAGDRKYALIGAEGIELGKKSVCQDYTPRTFKLHFKPLPEGTEKFDFWESDDTYIRGITDPAVTARQLLPSTWRDERTGRWEIGFFDEGVIYDSRFWDYVGDARPGTASRVEITDGSETLTVKIGKLKKGCRKITVGKRDILCSMITGRTLPDYPIADTRAEFIDNRYVDGDTAIVRGWLKDSPKKINLYSLSFGDLVSDRYGEEASCKVDSLGRFELKVPLRNTMECFMDWKNTFIRTVLEPGMTYYLLYDFGRGQKLFMGTDCRVQNELLAYPLPWQSYGIRDVLAQRGIDAYLPAVDSELNMHLGMLSDLCEAHPMLSRRFRDQYEAHLYNMYAVDLGQARFGTPGFKLTDSVASYLAGILANHRHKPYSLHRDVFTFISDFIDDHVRKDTANITLSTAEMGKIREKLLAENPDLDSIAEKKGLFRMVPSMFLIKEITAGVAFMDSLGVDEDLRSIWATHRGYEAIDNSRQSLEPEAVECLRENIKLPGMLEALLAKNEKYAELERRAKGASPLTPLSIPVDESVQDGRVLFDSIIAPHKGKIILVDVWGTWCAPCRAALAESQKEYAELAPYDMVYIYLANNSPEGAWRNVIEEYQVKGDNCFHYNLPTDQQQLIEKYLKVSGYPSYRLIDRNGNLLDVNADPRNLPALQKILDLLF